MRGPNEAAAPALRFDKMHGAANDFLFHEFTHGTPDLAQWQDQTRVLCHRRRGIGADGVVLWRASRGPGTPAPLSVAVTIINADGSTAETCGNAMRCLGLLLMRRGLWDGTAHCKVTALLPTEEHLAAARPVATLLSGSLSASERETERGRATGAVIGAATTPSQKSGLGPQTPGPAACLAQVFVDMGTCLGSAELSRAGHGQIQSFLTELLAELSEGAELQGPHNKTPKAAAPLPVCRYIQLANPHFVILLRPEHQPSPVTLKNGLPHTSKAILDRLESWLTRRGDALKRVLHDCALVEHCDYGGPTRGATGAHSKNNNAERTFDRDKVGDVNLGLLWNDGGQPDSPHVLVVHERGAGVTAACGSGCVAAAFALRLHRLTQPNATVGKTGDFSENECFEMPGGMLSVSLDPKSSEPSGTFNTWHDTAPFTGGPLEGAPTLWAIMGGEAVYVGLVAWDAHECCQA